MRGTHAKGAFYSVWSKTRHWMTRRANYTFEQLTLRDPVDKTLNLVGVPSVGCILETLVLHFLSRNLAETHCGNASLDQGTRIFFEQFGTDFSIAAALPWKFFTDRFLGCFQLIKPLILTCLLWIPSRHRNRR
jgi:hypothetical protein